MTDGFGARDIGLKAQKKLLGKMAKKNIAKVFIDETSASLVGVYFDNSKVLLHSSIHVLIKKTEKRL